MLLVPAAAPLGHTIEGVVRGLGLRIEPAWDGSATAMGSAADGDALDDALDPTIDRDTVARALDGVGVPSRAAPVLAHALADRETVLDLGDLLAVARRGGADRPLTFFEQGALVDVLGDLATLLPTSHVRIDRAPLTGASLNHCIVEGGRARIRLLATNGTTLAGRTHAVVHELGHALIGVARSRGRAYAAEYGEPDYGRWLAPRTFDRPMHEEALVRAIADAWLLRRTAVTWTRTWPGAVDACGAALDGDDLAAFCRFRLAQGLGLPAEPVVVRRQS